MTTATRYKTIFGRRIQTSSAQITVAISCFKYGQEATEALDSLLRQTEEALDLVVVDDKSPDNSTQILSDWFNRHRGAVKFKNEHLVQHLDNRGLSETRNTALSLVETPYIFILDADNLVYPRALQVLRESLDNSGYAMSYSLIERFGMQRRIVNNSVWLPAKFSRHPYIDAMALIRTDVLREVGGYRTMPDKFGWEDYDLWCSFVDRGLKGCHVPQILCRYRVHDRSMTETETKPYIHADLRKIREYFEANHAMPFSF
jgi:glycosyltransferase involved in cell wall biosynthesis